MTREERQQARRTERRKVRQADHVLTAAVRAIGGGDVDLWADDAEGQPEAVRRENGGNGE